MKMGVEGLAYITHFVQFPGTVARATPPCQSGPYCFVGRGTERALYDWLH